MHRKLATILMVLGLSACDSGTPSPSPQPDAARSPATAPEAAPNAVEKPTIAVGSPTSRHLPEGISLQADFPLVADRLITNDDGFKRRQTTLEYSGLDFAAAVATVSSGMEAAGFKGRPQRVMGGNTTIPFDKRGNATIYVIFNNTPNSGVTNPKSLITLDYDAAASDAP